VDCISNIEDASGVVVPMPTLFVCAMEETLQRQKMAIDKTNNLKFLIFFGFQMFMK
jgi:hypothetical protein